MDARNSPVMIWMAAGHQPLLGRLQLHSQQALVRAPRASQLRLFAMQRLQTLKCWRPLGMAPLGRCSKCATRQLAASTR